MSESTVVQLASWLEPAEWEAFRSGTWCRAWQKLGARPTVYQGTPGTHFAVWAPRAARVSVTGDFNRWSPHLHPLQPWGGTGFWTGFVPGVGPGAKYRFHVVPRGSVRGVDKLDPFAFRQELGGEPVSVVGVPHFSWKDAHWMRTRAEAQSPDRPVSIYEVHLGSWMRVPEEGNRRLTYRELAPRLADYVHRHGFTHVELLPITEHTEDASLGYQPLSFFAPTARHGSPEELMELVDTLHQAGVGVVFDWVAWGFDAAPFGLGRFDGAPLYETAPADPLGRQGPMRFDFSRPEVRSFLLSSAVFWLEHYHGDALRVGRLSRLLEPAGEHGGPTPGREDPAAITFLRQLNQIVSRDCPGALTMAAETGGRLQVARPVHSGGLGFGREWDAGFAADLLDYLSRDPLYRKFCHELLTRRLNAPFRPNLLLPLSHADASPGGPSLLARMHGDPGSKFAHMRLLLACLFFQPGKKLLFMGGEFGQWQSWRPDTSLDWHLIADGNPHNGLQKLVGTLNGLYRKHPALHATDDHPEGFQWVDPHDRDESTLSWLRKDPRTGEVLLVACNFTPVLRQGRRLGVPRPGAWREIFNSDAPEYGGQGRGNFGGVDAFPIPWHGQPHSVVVTLPPLAAVVFQSV